MDSSHVRVGVACFVWKDGQILMQQRYGAHGEGTWSVPGGHLEFGEGLEDCASREVLEETGVQINNVRFLALTNDIFQEKGKHYISIWMEADWFSGEPQITEPDKCKNVNWQSISKLPSPLFEPCWDNLRKVKPELFKQND